MQNNLPEPEKKYVGILLDVLNGPDEELNVGDTIYLDDLVDLLDDVNKKVVFVEIIPETGITTESHFAVKSRNLSFDTCVA